MLYSLPKQATRSVRSCAKRVGRRGLRIRKNRRDTRRLFSPGRNEERGKPKFALRRSKSRGYGYKCLSRGHGRNVARYSANVRPFYGLTRPEIDAVRG